MLRSSKENLLRVSWIGCKWSNHTICMHLSHGRKHCWVKNNSHHWVLFAFIAFLNLMFLDLLWHILFRSYFQKLFLKIRLQGCFEKFPWHETLKKTNRFIIHFSSQYTLCKLSTLYTILLGFWFSPGINFFDVSKPSCKSTIKIARSEWIETYSSGNK